MAVEWKCWCPDDTDESGAQVHDAYSPEQAAQYHAEWIVGRSEYSDDLWVNVIGPDGLLTEWEVCVDYHPTFNARPVRRKAAE
jgi:hypothetical protein